ncbi:MAG: tetratricopeptide repeat protein [Acidobacteria bacterium]|nr:tetratricopeptide repeat protein [Acidobacteriota bacterium]
MSGSRVRLMAVGMAVLILAGCGAGSGAFRAGHKAELRKDWDTALVNYERAVQANPGHSQYLLHEKLARSQASLFHLKRGRDLVAGGRPDEALGEFQKAVSIDPTNQAAAQELARILSAQAAAKRAREGALQNALNAREHGAEPESTELRPFSAEPLSQVRITADSRKVYETLGKLADVNIAFTSDFQARPLTLDLRNVKIEEALNIVAFQTKSFWRPITSNTILVIQDTPANRRDFAEQVVKTVYLSNPLQPADRTAITTALKQVLGLQRIIDNPDSNAIIIRDTPAQVAAAEKLIRDLDQGKAEILVEVSIMEADRNRVRDLGLLPGTQFSLLFTPSTGTVEGALPLNRLGSLSSRDYSLVMPGAVATALLTDSSTRILQNPQIRVTDGQTAKLRIGSRIPYATGSFLPSLGAGTATGGLIASTQFQYQEIGVNLDLTPRLLSNGEVSLHAMIEISSLAGTVSVGGLSQPTFGQRKIEHDIRLKEGEVNLLGGLIESTDRVSVGGVPGLSQIPGLKYLFSGERRERVETEVLVMLTPRVIRLPEFRPERGSQLPVAGEMGPPAPEVMPQQVEPPAPPQPPEQPQ